MIVKLDNYSMKYASQFFEVRELVFNEEKLLAFIENQNNLALMEVIEDKVVGLVWGYTLERLDDEPMMFIYSVDVIKEYRQRGIGKKLVKSFVDYANEHGYRNSFLITDKENIPANMLYKSLKGEYLKDKVLYFFKRSDLDE